MTKVEILNWLKEHNINDEDCRYTFNKDMSIDVDGDVRLVKLTDGVIPDGIKFNKVGTFFCYKNNMTSLRGCPEEVENGFNCGFNKLISLEGCPEKVGGNFGCSSNQLTSLKGGPEKVGGYYDCSDNKLTSLKGIVKSFQVKRGNYINIKTNKIQNLTYLPGPDDKKSSLTLLSDFSDEEVNTEQEIMKNAKTYEDGIRAYQEYLDIFGDE